MKKMCFPSFKCHLNKDYSDYQVYDAWLQDNLNIRSKKNSTKKSHLFLKF